MFKLNERNSQAIIPIRGQHNLPGSYSTSPMATLKINELELSPGEMKTVFKAKKTKKKQTNKQTNVSRRRQKLRIRRN